VILLSSRALKLWNCSREVVDFEKAAGSRMTARGMVEIYFVGRQAAPINVPDI